jgi:peroxiredoxin
MLVRKEQGFAVSTVLGLLALLCGLAEEKKAPEPRGLQPGTRAPDLTLLDTRGEKRSLSDFRGRKHVVLVLYPELFPAAFQQLRSLQDAAPPLARLDTVILAVSPPAAELNEHLEAQRPNFHLLADSNRTATGMYLAWKEADGNAQPSAFLIDKDGVIRRILRPANPERFGQDLIELMKMWQAGKATYDGSCARCHGGDGNKADYPFIKPLGGIGRRMTEEEILQATAATGIVNLQAFSQQELKALAIYVAGL